MTETQYEVMEAGAKAPPISLIRISGDRDLITSLDAFGPDCFDSNVAKMQQQHFSHPQTGETISLREPTTAESILAASYDFANRAKPKILDARWFQLGRIVRISEGVFANVPRDAQGNPITDEKVLKSYLNNAKPIRVGNGKIYIVTDSENLRDFGFAEYDSFETGVQDCDTFAQGGLARILEHSQKPEKLKDMVSKKNYPRGVNVWGFCSVDIPALRVAGLYSGRYLGNRQLIVDGSDWNGNYDGYAFGVLK